MAYFSLSAKELEREKKRSGMVESVKAKAKKNRGRIR